MSSSLTFLLAVCLAPEPAPAPIDYAALWEQGITFEVFLDEAVRRRDQWHANYGRGPAPADLVARAHAVGGHWRFLVVAEDWCGDSVNTIPYLARLVEAADNLELRVIRSELGRPVMEAHPTPDGRASTPTVILLDAADNVVGCMVERPTVMQRWWLANLDVEQEERLEQKYAWYDRDAGRQTLEELVDALEAASAGYVTCR